MPIPRTADDTGALIARMALGDEAALSALWSLHAGAVTALGARYLSDPDDGADIAQETFLRAWQNAARFDPALGTGRGWLFTIARNAARDRLRRRRLRWLVGLDTLPEPPPDPAPGPEAVTGARLELAQVRARIAELPDRQRMAILLATVGSLEVSEIAAIMQATPGAIEQLLVRARRTLRSSVDGGEGGN